MLKGRFKQRNPPPLPFLKKHFNILMVPIRMLTASKKNVISSAIFLLLFSLLLTFPSLCLAAANPNATGITTQILNCLESLPNRTNNRVISGQHIGWWVYTDHYDEFVTKLHADTGYWISLIGIEFGHDDNVARDRAIEHWNNGGLVTVTWHMDNPFTGTSRSISEIPAGHSLSELYTPGNAAYNAWREALGRKANWLKDFQNNNMVVLWRPFHEMNGNWFWWGRQDKEQFIALWRDMSYLRAGA